ncbi:MAG TPA: zinc-binding dehydrogenase [Candidatus Binatia bacterium]|nr:zinc-binding dehydrogenase [Candidatus Binatia bacterium]
MKAVRIHQHGGVEQLRYEEAPEPKLMAPTDVIVKLKAAALNRSDLNIRHGLNGTEVSLPHILGSDGAGIVSEVGEEVKNIREGDTVCLYPVYGCGLCEFCLTDRELMCTHLRALGEHENGTYAEYVRWPARNCFPIPAGLSFDEAAAFPLVYSAAWRMLITNAELKPGEQVLILGIGGGVATAALKIAAQLGTQIIVASSHEEKLAAAKALGARYGLQYREGDFAAEVRRLTGKRGVDVVVNCVGGETWATSLAALAKGGRLVTCGAVAGATPSTDIRRIFWNHLKVFGSKLGTREEFKQLLNFMEHSQIKTVIDKVFPLPLASSAHERLEAGEQFGKIVLSMEQPG